jgi:hypothetical protein
METPKTEQHRQVAAEMREARTKASDHGMTRAEFVAQSTTEKPTPETDAAITPKPVAFVIGDEADGFPQADINRLEREGEWPKLPSAYGFSPGLPDGDHLTN